MKTDRPTSIICIVFTLIPRDFNIPISPFSTAMKTDLRCSTSVLCRDIFSPKSSIVADSEMDVITPSRDTIITIRFYRKEQWRHHPLLPEPACCSSPSARTASPGSLGRGRPAGTSGSSRSPPLEAAWPRCRASRPRHNRQSSPPRRHTNTGSGVRRLAALDH